MEEIHAKYNQSNVPNSLEQIRNNRKFYLGEAEPNGIFLAGGLAAGALTSGARRVELCVLEAGWIAVSGASDWITPSLQNVRKGASLEQAFVSLIPQPGGRPNEVRFEPILTAFSRSVAIKSGSQWILISGEQPPREIEHLLANCNFAIAFHT